MHQPLLLLAIFVAVGCQSPSNDPKPAPTPTPAPAPAPAPAPGPPKVETCADKLGALAKRLGDTQPSIGTSTARDLDRGVEVPCAPKAEEADCKTAAEKAATDQLRAGEKLGHVAILDGDKGAKIAKVEILTPPRPAHDVARILVPVPTWDDASLAKVEQTVKDAGLELMLKEQRREENAVALTVTCPAR
jgi:hypothetical protein